MSPLRQKDDQSDGAEELCQEHSARLPGSRQRSCLLLLSIPDQLTKDAIEDYLLYLRNGKGNTTGSCGAVAAGLKFFYSHVIENGIPFDYQVRRKNRKLPTVLTQEEIWDLINAEDNLKHRLILMTTYSAGLRAMEVAALKPDHIDSKNMLIKLEQAKGGKERYTVLSSIVLEELR